jgi:alpha-ribazole phosphatase
MSGFLVHLLRHGAPIRPGLMLGHGDVAAIAPAAPALIARGTGQDISGIVSSDLRRAAQSGQAIAAAAKRPLTLDARWRELDFGAWDGQAPADLPADELARFWDDPDRCPPPDGERWSALTARVGRALADLSAATLVVTHAGAMRAALCILTGLDHRQGWAIDLPYGALLSLRVWPGGDRPSGQIVGLQTDEVP